MSFILQGPYPLVQTTVVLPSPKEGNNRSLAATVQTMRSMNGKLYTYIKSKRGRKTHQWDFIITKDKVREVADFSKTYGGNVLKILDHRDETYIGYLTVNPVDFEGNGRAGGYPSGEVYSCTISLEEKV